ncbi:MAG: S41 family peptidase, partial [Pseudomonadota bacterium]
IVPVVLAALVFVGACSSDNDSVVAKNSDAWSALTSADVPLRQRLLTHVTDRYLWYRDVPEIDITEPQYADLGVLLDSIRKSPEDRFSGFVDTQLQQQRVEAGVTGSFGLRYTLRHQNPDGSDIDIRIVSVEAQSTVAAAGLQRGDRIIAAQGQSVNSLGYDGFGQIFQEPGLGVERELTVLHTDGTQRTVTITRTEHGLSPVSKQHIFTDPDSARRVGYVYIDEFIRLTTTQLADFRAQFSAAGVDDLIVDLRYNGGGLVVASRDLASSIYGQADETTVYTTLQRNDKYTAENYTFFYRQFEDALTTLSRVFILTSASTCSASEEVINGLAPFMEVITIGATTCGKPYASRAYSLVPDLLDVHVLESRSVNANGDGDFFDGFTPVCIAEDDPVLPFNDAGESLISVALHYAEFGSCPSAPVATGVRRTISSSDGSASLTKGAIYQID